MRRATPAFSIDLPLEDAHLMLRVEGTATTLVPAQTSGPPEDCYPEEGGEVEIENVYLVHCGYTKPVELEISPLLLLLGDVAFAKLQELTEAALADRGAEPYEPDYPDED